MAWTPANLQFLLTRLREESGDAADVEVRTGSRGDSDLAETLSSFGNTPSGGTLVLGLDPRNRFAPTGIDDADALEAVISTQARTAVVPRVRVTFERTLVENEMVLLATVAGLPASARPCRTTRDNAAYLRQGTGNQRMSEQEIQQISGAVRRPRFDAYPVDQTSIADLDAQLRDQFLHAAKIKSTRLSEFADEEILRFKRVIEPHGDRLTLSGLYALGRYPQQFEPQLSITAVAEVPGNAGPRQIDRAEFDGPLPEMLDRAVEWVKRHTRSETRSTALGQAWNETDIPMDAVRELIANALVHRDLGPHTAGKNIQIRLSDGFLTVTSPGGLWGLGQDHLGIQSGHSAVNEFLYEICKITRTTSGHHAVEGAGRGLHDVRLSLRNAGYRAPLFHDNGVRFTVSVPRHVPISSRDLLWLQALPADTQLTEIQRQVLVSMRNGHVWTERLLRDEYSLLDSALVHDTLQGLVAAGLATATTGSRNPSYAISPVLASRPQGTLHGTAPRRTPRHVQPTPAQESGAVFGQGALPVPKKSKNAQTILGELHAGPLEVSDISQRTGLTANQIRYALSPLLNTGTVIRDGGQGHKITSYRLADR